MPNARLILAGATVACLAGTAANADLTVKRWPDDVPCSAITKSADGGWVLNSTIVQGPITRKSGEVFKEARVVRFWDGKCGSARRP